jgi:hypothetical protein
MHNQMAGFIYIFSYFNSRSAREGVPHKAKQPSEKQPYTALYGGYKPLQIFQT